MTEAVENQEMQEEQNIQESQNKQERQNVQVDQDSKNLALLLWIGTIFFTFIPGFMVYLIRKEDKFLVVHSKEALNWSITAIIAYALAFILVIIVIGALLLPIIVICHLVFCIMGAMKASKGEAFKVPFAIRLIK